ncbi:hypothetical protein ISN44_As06g034360 [Arabidopsis suecica]|uniref:Uncharacterized protein n=1 Tax=Arabidopsis suecica TaxID=45249 RepID=A0A8T2CQS9_ARASU|nr:hypothetical protein ISN44_As06g034360 [Arabidopsis suecica]
MTVKESLSPVEMKSSPRGETNLVRILGLSRPLLPLALFAVFVTSLRKLNSLFLDPTSLRKRCEMVTVARIAFPQMAPNFLRYILSTLTVSAEAGFSLSTSKLLGLFRARESAAAGIFSLNPILDRNMIDGMPPNDGPWRKYWFFFRVNPHSVQGGEEVGDIFRSFQTREGTSLPPFSVWRPEIRQMFVNRACYLSQLMSNASEIADVERDSARSDALRLESELEEATVLLEETNQKTELLIRNRARDIAEAEHNAREEMRGFGRQFIQSIMKFIKDEEVWTKLQSDRAELKSNLDLIGGIESGRISLEDERKEVSAELAIVESELSSVSRPSLDLGPFSLVFGDSPSQFEVGEGSRPYEGSPEKTITSFLLTKCLFKEIVGRHKALCDKRQRIGRRRRALDERIKRIEREILRLESEPHEWERNGLDIVAIMPTCLRRFLRMLDKFHRLSLATSDGSSFVSCSSEFRRLPMLRTEEKEEPEMKTIDDFSGPFDLSSDEGLSSECCSGSSTSLESLSGEDF